MAHVKKLDQHRTVKKKKIAVVRPIVRKGLKKNLNAPRPSEHPPVRGMLLTYSGIWHEKSLHGCAKQLE